MTVRRLLSARDVAELLGWSVNYWYRRRAALEAAGFPRPLRVGKVGTRWDPAAIEAWLAAKRNDLPGWEARLAARLEAASSSGDGGQHGTQAHPLSH